MIIENRFLAIGALEQKLRKRYLFLGVPISQSEDANDQLMNRLESIEAVLREQLRRQSEIF